MHRDLAFGTFTLALAAGYYALAARIPDTQLADAIGPTGLPKTYAFLLAGLSLLLIVRSVGRGSATGPSGSAGATKPGETRHSTWQMGGLLMVGVVYILAVPWLGYILSLTGLIAATTYYQGGVLDRKVLVIAASGALFFWVLFVVLLHIPHPPGMWPSLF